MPEAEKKSQLNMSSADILDIRRDHATNMFTQVTSTIFGQ